MNKLVYIVVAFAISYLLFGISAAAPIQQASCTPSAQASFNVVSVVWGTQSNNNQNTTVSNSQQIHEIAAGPGMMDVPLTLTLDNNNNCELVDVAAQMPLVSYFTDINGSPLYAVDRIQSVAPYSFFNVVYYLDIANNTPVGPTGSTYEKVNLLWNYTNSTEGYSASEQFYVPLKGSSSLLLNVTNHTLVAGQINEISFLIKNTGSGYAYAIKPSISSSSDVSAQANSTSTEIQSLAPNQTSSIELPVYVSAGASSQAIPISLDLNYINPYGENVSIPETLDMYAITPPSTLQISFPESITEGEPISANIMLSNSGSSPMTNMSVQLNPSSPLDIIGSDGYYTLSAIPAHGNVIIPVELYVASSSSTTASMGIDISYVFDGESQSSSRTLDFLTPGYINVTETDTTLLPAAPTIGGIFSVTGTLLNVGTTSATALSMTPVPPTGIEILGSNSTFLGTVSTDSPTAFTLSFESSPKLKPGTYKIPIILTYTNNLDLKQSSEIYLNATIGASTSAFNASAGFNSSAYAKYRVKKSGGYTTIIIAVIIIIIAVAGSGLYIRKKRRSRKTINANAGEEHKLKKQKAN